MLVIIVGNPVEIQLMKCESILCENILIVMNKLFALFLWVHHIVPHQLNLGAYVRYEHLTKMFHNLIIQMVVTCCIVPNVVIRLITEVTDITTKIATLNWIDKSCVGHRDIGRRSRPRRSIVNKCSDNRRPEVILGDLHRDDAKTS